MLARNGWRLVYGAGDVGLMGEVARSAQAAGGATFGVIPCHLMSQEVGKRDLTTFVVTETFLDHFGLETARDLPGLAELRAAGLLDSRPPGELSVPIVRDADEDDIADASRPGDLFGEEED